MTKSLTTQEIKEIAEQLDCGFRAFCHKTTNDLIFFPNEMNYPSIDMSAWEEEIDKLDENYTDYFEIEGMESRDSFRVMVKFADQLSDTKLQDRLYNALGKRHPFREFKYVIDNSGEHRQEWFDFKSGQYIEWVTGQLDRWEPEEFAN